MVWFKVDDGLPDNKKTRRVLTSKRTIDVAPMGLWVLAGCWASSNLTDGFIPKAIVSRWDRKQILARRLVDAEFWIESVVDAENGYLFLNWHEFNPTKAEVEAERLAARERMKKRRAARKGIGTSGELDDEQPPGVQANVQVNTTGTFAGGSEEVQLPRPSPIPAQPNPSPVPSLVTAHGEGCGSNARADDPPSPNCSKHPNGTTVACRPCGQAREARAKWDTDQARREGLARSAEARSRAEVRAQAIAACGMCDEAGYVGGGLCDHDPDTTERAARGMARVKAALNGSERA